MARALRYGHSLAESNQQPTGKLAGSVLRIGIWQEARSNQPLGSKPITRLAHGDRHESAIGKRPAGGREFAPAANGGRRMSANLESERI